MHIGVEWRMAKKHALLFLSIALLVIIISFSVTSANDSLLVSSSEKGAVDKTRGESFKVEVTFKNTGQTEGNWSVNVVFEGDFWIWKGTPRTLTLDDGDTKVLSWTGNVPANAKVNSVARLVVYYDDSFKALDWWIHVVSGGELTVKSSFLE